MSGCQMKKRCRAENPDCGLDRNPGFFNCSKNGSLKRIKCDVCCSEPGFCRECKCMLCGNLIRVLESEEVVLRCLQRISEAGVCGHAAHLHCAVAMKMAGVVKERSIDMEYLCRRCDKKTDLKSLVAHMLEEKRGSQWSFLHQHLGDDDDDGNVKRVPEAFVLRVLEKIQSGHGIQEVVKQFCNADHSQRRAMSCLTGEASNGEASLDQWLPSVSSAALHNSTLEVPLAVMQSSSAADTSPVSSSICVEISETNDSFARVGGNGDILSEQNVIGHSELGTRESVDSLVFENEKKQVNSLCTMVMENVWRQLGFEKPEKSEVEMVLIPDAPVAFDSIVCSTPSSELRLRSPAEARAHEASVSFDCNIKDLPASPLESTGKECNAGKSTEGKSDKLSGNAFIQKIVESNVEDRKTPLLSLGDPSQTPELLDSKYDADIQDALEKLKERQKREFSIKRDCLFSLKMDILNRHQELESARHDLVTQAPNMSLESVDALIKKISALSASMERKKISFESMLLSCKKKSLEEESL